LDVEEAVIILCTIGLLVVVVLEANMIDGGGDNPTRKLRGGNEEDMIACTISSIVVAFCSIFRNCGKSWILGALI
jgi:hypothetical protein